MHINTPQQELLFILKKETTSINLFIKIMLQLVKLPTVNKIKEQIIIHKF